MANGLLTFSFSSLHGHWRQIWGTTSRIIFKLGRSVGRGGTYQYTSRDDVTTMSSSLNQEWRAPAIWNFGYDVVSRERVQFKLGSDVGKGGRYPATLHVGRWCRLSIQDGCRHQFEFQLWRHVLWTDWQAELRLGLVLVSHRSGSINLEGHCTTPWTTRINLKNDTTSLRNVE